MKQHGILVKSTDAGSLMPIPPICFPLQERRYADSIHTIMTSGLILVTVTGIVGGMFENPTVTSIVKTISIGSLCATLLILFVLPGVLAACDKIVTKKRDRVNNQVK